MSSEKKKPRGEVSGLFPRIAALFVKNLPDEERAKNSLRELVRERECWYAMLGSGCCGNKANRSWGSEEFASF